MADRTLDDRELETTLRATLAGRAAQVTNGPRWTDRNVGSAGGSGDHHRRMRWLAPLAAAAAVAALVAGLFAVRGGDDRPTADRAAATSPDAPPVPAGMKPVSALGIEIFVPEEMRVDPVCGQNGVIRPVPPPDVVPSCAIAPGPVVTISTIRAGAPPAAESCVATVPLDGEDGCVAATPGMTESGPSGTRQAMDLTVRWPRHGVQVAVSRTFDESFALRTLRSAHAAPVDRNGCAARTDALLLPTNVPDPANIRLADGLPRPDPARRTSVCWYVDNRLVASGLLGSRDADQVLGGAGAAAPLFLPYADGSCAAVDRSSGVELITDYADGSTGRAVLHAAHCADRDASAPAGAFVANLGRLAGMPLTLGYRTGD